MENKNITLLIEEKNYLKNKLTEEFVKNGGILKANTNRNNYYELTEAINKASSVKEFTHTKGSDKPSAGEAQLQVLFKGTKLTFRRSFIDACYLYLHGQTKKAFSIEEKKKNLIPSLAKADNTSEIISRSENLEATSIDFQQKIQNLEQINTQLSHNFNTLQQEKQALEKQLQEHILWYKPPPIDEEVKLKDLLPFVNHKDSAFRKKMKLLVLSLMKGYDNFKTETAVKWHEKLKWYKEDEGASREGVFYYKSKDGYDFGIDKVTFTGFDKEGKDIETIAHQLFSDFTNTILGFKAEKINADFLNNLLDIDIDMDIDRPFCTAIIIYVGFVEKDITLMARYPAFSEDIKSFGNLFILNSRPWWRNAKDMKRREAFSWTDCIENQSFSIGLSKPYQTIRDAPNERCLWVEVPIEDSATMIIGIDLLKNDDF